MDVLLSLPIVSYFFSSSLTSWSTSLNLVFFYMTWSTLVLSHSPLRIELIGTTAIRLVLWLIPSLVFLLFDTLVPSLAESIKHTGASALPPRDAAYLSRTLGLALLNLALESALEYGLSLGLSTALGSPIFHTATTLPLPWALAKQLALLFAAREVLTYYIHRYALHSSRQSPRITALHKRYAHSHTRGAPYSLLVFADHPVPFLLHRFVPLYLPAAALRVHMLAYFVFVALSTLEETLAASGYSVVPGIMMGGVTRRCAAHYSSGGRGNFGAWGLLDWVNGTSVGGRDVVDDVRDEADKHAIKERSGNVMQSGIDGLRRSARNRKSRAVE